MEFRQAKYTEIDEILEIVEQAKLFLKEQNIDQWQNGYPNREVLLDDLAKKQLYVYCENAQIIGLCVLMVEEDINYRCIENGEWLQQGSYISVHRVAFRADYRQRGLAKQLFEQITNYVQQHYQVASLRIDTHQDNIAMQSSVLRSGFTYCGIIYLAGEHSETGKRLAYEKIL